MGAFVSSPRAGGGFRQGGRTGPARRETSMRAGLAIAAMDLVGACAAASPPPAAAPVGGEGPPLPPNSGGKALDGWTVSPSGDAVYTYSRAAAPARFFDYDLVTKRFRLP